MNDGITRAILNTGLSVSGGSNAPQIKLLELPAALQKQNVISGEVVANKDGKISLKTPQGLVVFEANVNVVIGQKINLKLQVVMQNAQQNLLVEVTTLTGQPIKPSLPTPAQPITAQPLPAQTPTPNVQLSDTVQNMPALPADPFAEYPLLQTKTVQLPKTLSPEALKILLNEILNFPPQNPLPPTLQEGLEKIRQIMPLLSQFGTLPAMPQNDVSEQNIILSLMQLVKTVPTTADKGQINLASWPIENISLLQTILPGESLTKDTLVGLLNQLQNASNTAQEKLTTPLTALVLGQKSVPSLPIAATPTLLLAFTPDMQQAMMFVTAMQKSSEAHMLPGSVLLMNMPSTSLAGNTTLPLTALLNSAAMPAVTPLHPGIGDTWPALQELWTDVLAQQAILPDVAASLKQTLPTPVAQQMPAAALFFLAALRQGMPSAWFGEGAIDKLQHAEKLALISQLGRDMQSIQNAMDGPTDVWRPIPMPLQIGTELVRMQWFYRHQYEDLPSNHSSEEEEESKKRRKTRFILNVPQTRVGDLQLDGLMHEKNLDMILRTENTISSVMENAIRERYHQALETSGIVGGISFQAGRQQYVNV